MAAVQAIYSHYVLHDLCSFEEEVPYLCFYFSFLQK